MAQLIRTSINLTANGASSLPAPSGSQTVTIPASGNNTFTQPNGLLQSPNWPSSYANSANGFTVFSGIPGVTRSITGTVNTESGYDFVRVYNGSGVSGTLLYTVSGAAQNFSFTSTPGQTFTVQFTSDVSVASAGFSLTVTGVSTPPPGSITYRTVDNSTGSETVIIPASGNNTFSQANGLIQSPSWPSAYPAAANGYTVFTGIAGITRTISGTISVENNFDFVRVYDGSGTSGTLLYTRTGTSTSFSFTSTPGQTFTVAFTSDYGMQLAGFSLTVTGSPRTSFYAYDSGINSPYAVGTGAVAARSTTATTYTSSGTWNNPLYSGENISMVLVFLLGGGGGGAAGPNSTTNPTLYARGGAGGGASIMVYPAIALGPTYPITVGAGGYGPVSGNGASGGTTSFGHLPGTANALTGGSGWFGTLYAAGGSGGTQAAAGAVDLPGGNGLYIGSASSINSTYLASLWYSGPAGGRGAGGGGIAHPGGAAGLGFSGVATTSPAINGGASGTDGTTGTNGTSGTNPSSTGIMRAGSAGGGGGKATTAAAAGHGAGGGRGAGGGGGGSAPTGGTPGFGGDGGSGYAIIVSW